MSVFLFLLQLVCVILQPQTQQRGMTNDEKQRRIKELTPLQASVTQEGATERPFTGIYYQHRAKGTYH